ncbi:primase, DNA, polypeptide 1 (49kDa) [Kappamyces sp. JEL0829]|nr:primase, DNA, polypeptide 1 (49kDa) [Kappamyces sp. JEL0829]
MTLEVLANPETDAEMLPDARSPDYDFPQALKLYYAKMFPFKEFYNWLSYGNVPKYYFANREFSFTLPSDAYIRFQSFQNDQPKDKKTVQASAFVPLERELVFDIDMTDYDDIRTCCSGADICNTCWSFMTVAIKVLHQALTDDFGFKHLLWVYSGRRGVHCWVCDDRARALSAESRKAIVGYLELLKGGENSGRKVTTKGTTIHPHLARSLVPCASFFSSVMMGSMRIFESRDHWTKLLGVIPDEGVGRERLTYSYPQRTGPRLVLEPLSAGSQEVGDVADKAAPEQGTDSAVTQKPGLDSIARDIVFQYSYPRLDSHVSIGLNHLLKSPFCVHPKTGNKVLAKSPIAYTSLDQDPDLLKTEFDNFLVSIYGEYLENKEKEERSIAR